MNVVLTAFLQLEQNSKLHVGHKTERGSNKVAAATAAAAAFDEEGCGIVDCADVDGDDNFSFAGITEHIVSQFRFGHQSRYLSSSTSAKSDCRYIN
jgi:hypothetical protein